MRNKLTDKCCFSIDGDLIIRSWNSSMEKLSYREAKDVVGNNVKGVFPLLCDDISRVFSDNRKRHLKDFRNICFMGTDLSADIRIIPVRNKKGEIIEANVVLDNISGKCPLTKQLADSEKMVAIGKIASSLAHGVRNPLNAIKGAVVYLRERYGHESTLLEFSKIIYDEINKLDNFISVFLSSAKGDSKFIPLNLNEVLESIFIMIKPQAEMQGIQILRELSVLPLISADSFQIEQAVFNIINNAIEAMPAGGAIGIKTSLKREGDNDYAVIEISDTAGGISEKELRNLGDLSENPERNDRGFGIFLSREVIKAHRGKLLWESVRDRGTTFKIFLPVKESGQSE